MGTADKLSFSPYEQGDEVLQDYGMVRFVNIQKRAEVIIFPKEKPGENRPLPTTRLR